MQFEPATWAEYGAGGDVDDDHDAILTAARYLATAGAPGDMERAVLAYDDDPGYVDAVAKYAEVMLADEDAYRGYHGWQVIVETADGAVLLPVGYGGTQIAP